MPNINSFIFILFTFFLTNFYKTAVSAPISTSRYIATSLHHVGRVDQPDIATMLVGPAPSESQPIQENPQRPNQLTKQLFEQPIVQPLQQSNPTAVTQQNKQPPLPTENDNQPSTQPPTSDKPQEPITANNEKEQSNTPNPTDNAETAKTENTKATTENDPPSDTADVNVNKADNNDTESLSSPFDSIVTDSTEDADDKNEDENKMSLLLVAIGGSGAGLIVIISVVTCFCCSRIRKSKQMSNETLKVAEIRQDPEIGNAYVPPAPEMRKYVMDDRRDSTPWGHPPEALTSSVVEPEVNRSSRSGIRIPSLRSQS